MKRVFCIQSTKEFCKRIDNSIYRQLTDRKGTRSKCHEKRRQDQNRWMFKYSSQFLLIYCIHCDWNFHNSSASLKIVDYSLPDLKAMKRYHIFIDLKIKWHWKLIIWALMWMLLQDKSVSNISCKFSLWEINWNEMLKVIFITLILI